MHPPTVHSSYVCYVSILLTPVVTRHSLLHMLNHRDCIGMCIRAPAMLLQANQEMSGSTTDESS